MKQRFDNLCMHDTTAALSRSGGFVQPCVERGIPQ
jgi:hypothetical protein